MDADEARIAAITGAAGAGFRLSLVLNAVKMKMQNADTEIQRISRAISDFSLMLKQVARTMEEGGVQPTPLAVDTVFDIKDHSEQIFEEIKGMTELAQKRDEDGNLTEIGIGQRVVWCFKQQKVPYLLGQLDYLKLNLAIMLQVLQLAKVASSTRPRPTDRFMTQERAEIQNMIVLQHWSMEDLKTLFVNAQDDVRRDSTASNFTDDPPPKYEDTPAEEVRLAIAPPPRPPKESDASQALVKYQEHPIQQLDESLHQALSRENQVLSAEVPDIVTHLLREWTIPEYLQNMGHPRALTNGPSRPTKSRRHQATVSSSEGDTTESYDSSDFLPKGYLLEGPGPKSKPNGVKPKKQLRFSDELQPRVDDESDEEDRRTRRRSTTKRHILRSNVSSESDSDSDTSPPSQSRRSRLSSSDDSHASHKTWDRSRRPYNNAGTSGSRNSPPEREGVRMAQRGHVNGVGPGGGAGNPQSPRTGPMPVPILHQHNNYPPHHPHPQPHQSSQLRPPAGPHHYSHPGTGPGPNQRPPSQGNPYVPQYQQQQQQQQQQLNSPTSSPVMLHGSHFPQNQSQQQQPRSQSQQRGVAVPPLSLNTTPPSSQLGTSFPPPPPPPSSTPGSRPPRPGRAGQGGMGSHSQHSSYEGGGGGGKYVLRDVDRRDGHRERGERGERSERKSHRHGEREREKEAGSASRNIKKGIGIGAAAAGLMELLSGLDGI